jgi:tetratricopeptide (TPR) repeat protein
MYLSNRILFFSIIIYIILVTAQCSSPSSEELVKEALKHNENGSYNKSYNAFLKATKLDPNNVDAFYGLGGMYNLRNNYEKAAETFKYVIKLDPTHFNARYSLGFTYEKLGKSELAKIQYARHQSLKKRFKSMTTKE